MLDRVLALAEGKDFKSYAWELFSGVSAGGIPMCALIELILQFYQKQMEAEKLDEDEWAFISRSTVYDLCGYFAFALLKKGLLDRRWTYEGGALSDGGQSVSMEEIQRACVAAAEGVDEEDAEYVENWMGMLDQFDPAEEAVRLAPLNHCTAENALTVMGMLRYLHEHCCTSLQDLERHQRIWPEQTPHDELIETIARVTYDGYCHCFLEQCDPHEQDEAYAAYDRIRTAKTVAAAVFAEVEFAFWLLEDTEFPCSAYWFLTGLQEDMPFPEKVEESTDYTVDPRLSQEGRQLLAAACAGNADAQDTLSQMYLTGKSAPHDEVRAAYWMKRAAEQGVPGAMCNYGVALQRGLGGIQPDSVEAFIWLMQAAQKGEATAQLNVGLAYAAGRGVERDLQQAKAWFRKAAENGNAMAQMILDNGLIINN